MGSLLVLDGPKSRIRVRTYAEGMFARLAHDIEIVWKGVTGTADPEKKSAVLVAKIGGAEVAGVLDAGEGRVDRVDATRLSTADKRDILAKMRREVFHAGEDAVIRVEAEGDHATLILPGATARVPLKVAIYGDTARGSFSLSLDAIGSDVVKGPMGAFRVKDKVDVLFELVFNAS